MINLPETSERIVPKKFKSRFEYLNFLRHFFVYHVAKKEILESDLVLDLGFGEGYGASFLSDDCKHLIALDVEDTLVSHASGKYSSSRCVFKTYDARKIPYSDDFFDVVVSFQVIEHIQDDLAYISEIHRVLKKGGLLILTTPNREYRLKKGQKPWNKFHVREYHPEELKELLKKKFSEIDIKGVRGRGEVQKIEKDRVKQGLSRTSFLPEAFKKMIPSGFKKMIVKKPRTEDVQENFVDKYSLNDFYLIDSNIRKDSLDIISFSRK